MDLLCPTYSRPVVPRGHAVIKNKRFCMGGGRGHFVFVEVVFLFIVPSRAGRHMPHYFNFKYCIGQIRRHSEDATSIAKLELELNFKRKGVHGQSIHFLQLQ